MLTLLRMVSGSWEQAQGYLRKDLETIQIQTNRYIIANDAKWKALFLTTNPIINDGNLGASFSVDWSTGPQHRGVLTANTTLRLLNPVDGGTFVLYLSTGAGGFTVTWPSTVKWAGGVAPTITATANKTDVVSLRYVLIQNVYYASIVQNY